MDPSRLTNWPAIKDFVPTAHTDTYAFISSLGADLSGKSVFITGASKGIGKAIALSFARAGCSKIAVAARSGLSELTSDILLAAAEAGRPAAAPQVLSLQIDVTSEGDVASAASQIAEAFGGSLDVLVCNAGRAEDMVLPHESRVGDFWATWEVNVKGVYLCTRALVPLLLKSATRTIVTVSSAGAHMLVGGLSGYQTSKFAICRFMEFVAKEYEDAGLITVSLHPGDVLTDITAVTPKEWHSQIFIYKPELAGDTIVWLAKERREWLSGRFVNTAWDMSELESRRAEILERDLLKFRLVV